MALLATNEKIAEKKVSSSAYKILIKPRVTEKAHRALALNQYVFRVAKDSTKTSVKRAVESVYGVKVLAVNITVIPAKKRRFGRGIGYKSSFKKAVVTLKDGDAIEFFQAE
jgi:large subunit ribosomal protein L23